MLPKALIKGYDKGRLRNLLTIFFLALAIPTAVLIWHAYGQLKWEAFHQYRGLAEELTSRIDARLIEMIRSADTQSFADYTFLIVTGDPSANFLQHSPLSAYPVTGDPPGLLGYFQVDTRGEFSSPLLPPEGSDPGKFGIGEDEFKDRLLLTREIREILADNRLVHFSPEAMPSEQAAVSSDTYSQQVFDRLNMPRQDAQSGLDNAGERDFDDAPVAAAPQMQQGQQQGRQRAGALGKVADLKLDSVLEKKSEEHESQLDRMQLHEEGGLSTPSRTKRKEQINLAESEMPSDNEPAAPAAVDLRIRTFESEVDPLDFSMLDSGHLVLFRKVWRGGERYIQGLLIDQQAFIEDTIDAPFMETALSNTSQLTVALGEDVIYTASGCDSYNCPNGNQGLDGALVFRDRLSAPLDSIELIFSISRLQPGPGAAVLGWVTLVLALVFLSGFYTMYRLGLSQINLARQQQDFVSAVSHELKTPLTSIRMYGEMLKEGWADEEKKKTYYEYIHDESERLTRLISNVLQLANITRNEPQLDLKPEMAGELMSNIESKIANQVQRAGFRLRFTRDDETDLAAVMIDEDCFAQIIINLVDNAIKFSENADNKTIEITSKLTSDNQVLFSVRDFGPGVPKDQMKKIFQLFYRPESELTRETVGTGIGLAIVHQLTVAMDGKVDIVNREAGAEFTVKFSRNLQRMPLS
jgi:signal transduction histidine kinase